MFHKQLTYIRYIYIKKNATICKICVPQSDKTTRHTRIVCLRICAGSIGYGLRQFLQNALQFSECAAFSRQKVPQSKDCGTLQDGTLQHGHQSVVHTVGEKRHTWRHIFKCRGGVFVDSFLTYSVSFLPSLPPSHPQGRMQ